MNYQDIFIYVLFKIVTILMMMMMMLKQGIGVIALAEQKTNGSRSGIFVFVVNT